MLQWSCGLTKLDRIGNERIRVRLKLWKYLREYTKGDYNGMVWLRDEKGWKLRG